MYLTIRQEAQRPECPFTQFRLRQLIAQGKIPGFRVGNRFLINHELLMQMTTEMSLANIKGAEKAE